MRYYFIGGDESYENKKGGLLVLNFFTLESEEDYSKVKKILEKIKRNKEIDEIKNHNSNDKFRENLFVQLKEVVYKNYVYSAKLCSTKDILKEYRVGILKFANFLAEKIHTESTEASKFEIELDKIGSLQFQFECIKIFRNAFRDKNIKHSVRFLDSKKSALEQISDIFAGEIRKNLLGEVKFEKYLSKNKNSIL